MMIRLRTFLLRFSLWALLPLLAVGCGEDAPPEGIPETELSDVTVPEAGLLPPSDTDSDISPGEPATTTDETALDSSSTPATVDRETVEIQPYTGPPILLDEPAEAPPATVAERRTVKEEYDDGSVRSERGVIRYSDDRITSDGKYREYFRDGQLFVEGQYREGDQVGEWTYWHPNGQVQRKVTYKDGKPDGSWEVFREDGTLHSKRSFTDGQRDGEWTFYNETGEQPIRVANYQAGKPHGEWKDWYPNGQQKTVRNFRDGKQHGQAIQWDEEGNKRQELNYDDGKLDGTATLWSADGKKVTQEYDQGRLVAESTE